MLIVASIGLGWASFQVMRRTHSTLMNKLQVDPKLVADQLGHTLDLNQNVYTIPELGRRREAVNQLEAAPNLLMEYFGVRRLLLGCK